METNPVSAIAHRLRTPLTVVTSTVNNLLDGAFGPLAAEQVKWLKKLESHTQSLDALLNEILSLLKSQPDKTREILSSLSREDAVVSKMMAGEAAAPAAAGDDSSGRKVPTVLIVDDEPDIREVIEEGLGTKGLKTLTASDGDEALKLALQHQPDLVLMDVLLKNQNGMEVCRQIKSRLSSFTPVILVTGQDDLREKIAGSGHDADDLLTKPFQMEELFARVTSMLRMKSLHDQLLRATGGKEGKK